LTPGPRRATIAAKVAAHAHLHHPSGPHRTPRRRPRWPRRVAGLLGTAALAAVAVAVVLLLAPEAHILRVAPSDDPQNAVVTPAPASTPEPAPTPAAEAPKPRRPQLSRGARQARTAALAQLREQGYVAVRVSDYDASHTLRVLIGRPAGEPEGARRAFFFHRRQFLGHDTTTPSAKLRAGPAEDLAVTLVYGRFAPGDQLCCPSGGSARVRYQYDGTALRPTDPIPLAAQRLPDTVG
jgi:LppP/LprE lipoprotein